VDIADARLSPGAAAAVTTLYAEHALGLVRLAVVLTGDRGTAEDIVQDAFLGLSEEETARTRAAPRPARPARACGPGSPRSPPPRWSWRWPSPWSLSEGRRTVAGLPSPRALPPGPAACRATTWPSTRRGEKAASRAACRWAPPSPWGTQDTPGLRAAFPPQENLLTWIDGDRAIAFDAGTQGVRRLDLGGPTGDLIADSQLIWSPRSPQPSCLSSPPVVSLVTREWGTGCKYPVHSRHMRQPKTRRPRLLTRRSFWPISVGRTPDAGRRTPADADEQYCLVGVTQPGTSRNRRKFFPSRATKST
jgi:hypothetical protein